MRPIVEDLQAFWRFTYSRASLLAAAEFLAELNKVKPESIQYRALVEAAVVAYARPFTTCYLPPKRKQVKPLGEIPPPQHLSIYHKDALDLRDTMIAHKDATPAKGYTDTPNKVLVNISPRISLDASMIGEMLSPATSRLSELCAYFVKHCEENLNRLTKLYRSELTKYPPGKYELVICEPHAD